MNTNFYVDVSNPSTSLISNFLHTYSVFEVRHILFNQPNDSSLWAAPAKLTPLTHVRTLNVAYGLLIVLKRCEYLGMSMSNYWFAIRVAQAIKNTILATLSPESLLPVFFFRCLCQISLISNCFQGPKKM